VIRPLSGAPWCRQPRRGETPFGPNRRDSPEAEINLTLEFGAQDLQQQRIPGFRRALQRAQRPRI